ncbi:hypothetical protein J7M22_12170 [Candidatus Poribacteria bacterium]|nr:hypothetical protein [Candidatus Poribacteria bacterium]
MIRDMRKSVGAISLMILLSSAAFGAGRGDMPFAVESVRILSLGGAYTALTDEENTVLYNPACLEYVQESKLAIFGLRANLNEDTVESTSKLINSYIDANKLRKIHPSTIDELRTYHPLVSLSGPIQISYVRDHFGFSLLNPVSNAKLSYDYKDGAVVKIKCYQDAIATLAYGGRVYRDLSVGLAMKYLVRCEVGRLGGDDILQLYDMKGNLYIRRGLGWNFGMTYEIKRWSLRVGLSIRDLFGTDLSEQILKLETTKFRRGGKTEIKRATRIGLCYQPDFKIPFSKLAYYPYSTLIAFDFGDGKSFGEKFHLGVEIKPFRWLALRMGVNDGIRLGLGLRTAVCKLDYMFSTGYRDRFLGERVGNVHAFSLIFSY